MDERTIIPFGKYNGQPVEVLQNDPQYCQWLSSQEWFRERYSQINTLIINNFTKPEDTPEHNALQALFLDDKIVSRMITLIEKPNPEFLLKFYEAQYGKCMTNLQKQKEYISGIAGTYGEKYLLVPCNARGGSQNYYYFDETARYNSTGWCNPETPLCHCRMYVTEPEEYPGQPWWETPEFEVHGWDVHVKGGITGAVTYLRSASEFDYYIEVKPCLGDDYPSILRQMKTNEKQRLLRNKCILVYKEFTAKGATLEQVKKIFESSEYIVLSFAELEAEE